MVMVPLQYKQSEGAETNDHNLRKIDPNVIGEMENQDLWTKTHQ